MGQITVPISVNSTTNYLCGSQVTALPIPSLVMCLFLCLTVYTVYFHTHYKKGGHTALEAFRIQETFPYFST